MVERVARGDSIAALSGQRRTQHKRRYVAFDGTTIDLSRWGESPLSAVLRPLYLKEQTFPAQSPTGNFDPELAIRIGVANFCLQALRT